jgi:hypothetical protein
MTGNAWRKPWLLLRQARARLKLEMTRQQRRNESLGDWWRLPLDRNRTTSPWKQLTVDLTSPAMFSVWHTMIATSRVEWYDRVRPGVTRGVLALSIAVCLYGVGLPAPFFAFLLPAVLQASLEVYLHFFLAKLVPDPRQAWVRFMVGVVRSNYDRLLVNGTGLIGVVACPLNIVLVCFAPSGGDLGWVKVAGLVVAIFYLNSGLSSAFLDPPNYTENSDMPRLMHTLRPYAPVISLVVVFGIIWLSIHFARWEPSMVPLACMSSLFTLLLGGTIRNHDRVIAASIPVAREVILLGRQDMAKVAHDTLNSVKGTVDAIAELDQVPFTLRNKLSTLPAMLTHLHAQAGIDDSDKRMTLQYLAGKILDGYDAVARDKVSYDFRWGELGEEDYEVAVKVTTALCLNVAQALSKPAFTEVDKSIRIEGFTSGAGRDLRFNLAVYDRLPLVAVWCPPGRSLTALRALLQSGYNGSLEQQSIEGSGKRIIASWSDRAPLIPFGKALERAAL